MIKRQKPLKGRGVGLRDKSGLKRKFGASRGIPKPQRPKEKSISKLMKEADKLFSIQVRMKGAWETEGIWWNNCYTHDTEKYRMLPVKKLHCGHFLSRIYKAARWDFDNARPQDYVCNILKKGDSVEFRNQLIKEIGLERVEAVEAKRYQTIKLTREYLTNLIQTLKEQIDIKP